MNITLRQLTYFRALAQHRNFGRAAEAVHVSQPALSVQIRDLESALGGRLVERRARDVVLTPFGRMVLDQARTVLDQMRVLADLGRWNAGLSGELRLGLIPTVAPYLLPGALAAIRQQDIGLSVQVQEGKTERLLAELRAGQLDAAVLATPWKELDAADLHSLPLFEDRFVLAGTPARIAVLGEQGETLRPEQIGPEQLMLLEDGHCLTDQALAVCGRPGQNAQINMGASSLATLTRLVAAGFGLTLLPELALSSDGRDLALRRFSAPQPRRTIALVRRVSSTEDGWFRTLATILTEVGEALVAQTGPLG